MHRLARLWGTMERKGPLIEAIVMGLVVAGFLGISGWFLLGRFTPLGGSGMPSGAPPAYYMPAGPTEAEAGGVHVRVEERGWYGGGYMAFIYAVTLPETYRGWAVTPERILAATADGRAYEVADLLPLGTVDVLAVGVFTLRLPEAGDGILTLTIPALQMTAPEGHTIKRLDGPWAVSPLEFFGRQPNPQTRITSGSGAQLQQGRANLVLTYRDLTGCPESFDSAATSTPDIGPGLPTPTPYTGPEPVPTATRAPLSPPYLRGLDPDGVMFIVASVCSPDPHYLAARVTGPDGNLELATIP